MGKTEKRNVLIKALHALGYNRIEGFKASGNRIYLNGEYFGIFDFGRGLFVD